MSPEIIKGHFFGTKSDVWSLGIILLELIEGEPVYFEEPPLRALFKISRDGVPPLKQPEKWSYRLKDFYHSSTVFDQDKRFSTSQLISHPFLKKCCTKEEFSDFVKQVQLLKENLNYFY